MQIVENLLQFYTLLFLTIFVGMFALYRVCYPYQITWNALPQIARDLYQLFFTNITEFILPADMSIEAEKRRYRYIVAFWLTLLVCIILLGIGACADDYFAYVVRGLCFAIMKELPCISISIFLGFIMAMFVYGYIIGLIEEQVEQNPNWYFHKKIISVIDKQNDKITFFSNDQISLSWILNMLIICNNMFLFTNIWAFWNPLNFPLPFAKFFIYNNNLIFSFIWMMLNCAIFIMEYNYIICGSDEESNRIDLRKKLFYANLICVGIWVFTMIKYFRNIYIFGIKNDNRLGFPLLIILLAILIELLIFSLQWIKYIFTRYHILCMLGVLSILIMLWNGCHFPMYNFSLFEEKYKNNDLEYYLESIPKEQIIISRRDVDIFYMEESGRYAIPYLVGLLEYINLYEDTKKSISETSLDSIVNICSRELDKYKENINNANGFYKLQVIVNSMEQEPSFAFGYRAYCLQVLKTYIDSHEINSESIEKKNEGGSTG